MTDYVSNQNGWADVATNWTPNGIPGSGDTISVGHIIGIRNNLSLGTDTSGTTSAITITSGGKLKWGDPDNEIGGGASPVNASWTLTLTGRIDIQTGGEWEIGNSTYEIPSSYVATVDFSSGSYSFENIIRGTITLYGASDYHMGDTEYQRTQLTNDVYQGNDRTFNTKAAVDWEVGDEIWVGIGGYRGKYSSGEYPFSNEFHPERITIKTKISASSYTADFSYTHRGGSEYGEILVNGDRNIIIKSDSDGMSFHMDGDTSQSSRPPTGIVDISWVRFENLGFGNNNNSAGFGIHHGTSIGTQNKTYRMSADNLKIKNTIFYRIDPVVTTTCLYFNDCCIEEDLSRSNLDMLHFWGYTYAVYAYTTAYGLYRFGKITSMNCVSAFYMRGPSGYGLDYSVESAWYCGTTNYSTSTNYAIQGIPGEINEFKAHRPSRGIYWNLNKGEFFPGSICKVQYAEIFFCVYSGFGIYIVQSEQSPYYLFKNVKIISVYSSGLYLAFGSTGGSRVVLIDCDFDDCNRYGSNSRSAIRLGGDCNILEMYNCKFGMYGIDTRNKKSNVDNAAENDGGYWRIIATNCQFKEADHTTYQSDFWVSRAFYGASIGNFDDVQNWENFCRTPTYCSYELIDCDVYDSGDNPLWDTDYPNTSVIAFVAGGGEIHKTHPTLESDGYIDGTYQRKFMPFLATTRCHMTLKSPIRIPVTSGQTVTVKLSLKKNISQEEADRPQIHLDGCGIFETETMSDAVDTWEELTIQATPLYNGVLNFWVSCRGVQDYHTYDSPPSRDYKYHFNYAYPIEPGGTGTGVGTPQNLILYADGLSIEHS